MRLATVLAVGLSWLACGRAELEPFVKELVGVVQDFLREASTYSSEGSFGRLPDLEADFLLGGLRATGGHFHTTFKLSEKDLRCTIANTVTVQMGVTLENFQAGYKNCSIRVGGVTGIGNLTFNEPRSNSLKMVLEYSRSELCNLKAYNVEVRELGGFKVDAGNLSPFQSAAMVVGEWMMASMEGAFRDLIRKKVEEILKETAKGHQKSFCPILPK